MSLADRLATRIRVEGPMTLADYMIECLFDPDEGYYASREPFGASGDFTTAPEISQMFGELVGLALAQTWLDHGAPTPFGLVELGPGRGTLLADMLRATKGVTGFHAALSLHLVEASRRLRDIQRQTIDHPLTHHDDLSTLPEEPLFVVANEFFDALPIRQFQRTEDGWRERLVGLVEGRLTLGLGDITRPPLLDDRLGDTAPGAIVELNEAARRVAGNLGERIARLGGAALIVDYGDWRSRGDTFQAMRAHAATDPLAEPGHADLTAHVDFEALALAARPALATPMVTQGDWLLRLGIEARASVLSKSLTGARLDKHDAALARLTARDEMGTLFKVLGLFAPGHPPPPGFHA